MPGLQQVLHPTLLLDTDKFTTGISPKLPAPAISEDDKQLLDKLRHRQQFNHLDDFGDYGNTMNRSRNDNFSHPPRIQRATSYHPSDAYGTPSRRYLGQPHNQQFQHTYNDARHLPYSAPFLDRLLTATPVGTTREDIVQNAQQDPLYLGRLMDELIKLEAHESGSIKLDGHEYPRKVPSAPPRS